VSTRLRRFSLLVPPAGGLAETVTEGGGAAAIGRGRARGMRIFVLPEHIEELAKVLVRQGVSSELGGWDNTGDNILLAGYRPVGR
jgi:hypothetical protein